MLFPGLLPPVCFLRFAFSGLLSPVCFLLTFFSFARLSFCLLSPSVAPLTAGPCLLLRLLPLSIVPCLLPLSATSSLLSTACCPYLLPLSAAPLLVYPVCYPCLLPYLLPYLPHLRKKRPTLRSQCRRVPKNVILTHFPCHVGIHTHPQGPFSANASTQSRKTLAIQKKFVSLQSALTKAEKFHRKDPGEVGEWLKPAVC